MNSNKVNFDYNIIPAGYYDRIYHKKKGLQSSWHYLKFQFVKELIPKNGKHLDIGCGPGTFLGLLKKKSFGIDISYKQIAFAKKKYQNKKINFLCFKKRIPFRSNYFNSISLIEIVEHLKEKHVEYLIKESSRVLKKNGTITITTPNYYSLWPIIEYFMNLLLNINYKHQHINKFTMKKLLKIIPIYKFKILDSGSFMCLAPFFGIISFNFAISFFKLERFFKFFFPGNLLYIKVKVIK